MKKKKCNFHLTKLEFSVKLLESTLMLGEKYAGGGIFKNHFIVTIYILALAICVSTFFVPTNIKAAVSLNLDYENGAYLIRDFSDLENLSEYVYTGGSTSGKTFKLTNSIDMKSQSFIPIGTIYNGSPFYFDGTFDGQGYTILNLNIDTNSTYAAGDLGIFGYLNGTVKNLSICYGDIYLTTTDKSAGGIVGSMYGSAKVERCYNLGTKVYTYSGSRSFNIGGVIGFIQIQLPLRQLHHAIADALHEIAVVCHHEQCAAHAFEILFQPGDHLCIQMVGRLIQDQQIAGRQQHLR